MSATGGEGLEKLEDMIVRTAESTASHVQDAKAAVGKVVFGQERWSSWRWRRSWRAAMPC